MELYPGMRAHMGRWSYFIVKMTMREVAESVKFASDVYNDFTLDEAIQRILKESCGRKRDCYLPCAPAGPLLQLSGRRSDRRRAQVGIP